MNTRSDRTDGIVANLQIALADRSFKIENW